MNRADYNVGGVISPRPFRLRRLGHIAYDVDHTSDTLDFFVRDLGLHVSDVLDLRRLPAFEQAASTLADPRVVFLTTGNDHHSVVLLPRPIAVAFRGPQVPADITNAHISFQLNGVDEVVAAKSYLVTRIGPVWFFVDDVERSARFYTDMLGMSVTERANCRGGECVFLRNGTEHHSLALYSERLCGELGLGVANRNFALGLQLGSYDQLRRAGLFMAERGWRQTMDIPPELYTGIDRALFFEDPQANRIMLYYYMEQIGWDGRPRPAEARVPREKRPVAEWPESIRAPSDVYTDPPLMGRSGKRGRRLMHREGHQPRNPFQRSLSMSADLPQCQ
jgi:catechol 2,3-dioxygenase-like lactoylglutathione lyase family enzyme